jgi:hypothetical protein
MPATRTFLWRMILADAGIGAVVLGLGSRAAMRVVGLAASPEHLGEPTEFGTVGRITLEGTLQLLLTGAIVGVLVGLLYLAIRAWIPGRTALRGFLFGLLLLPPIGVFILKSSESDFDLTSQALIFALFGGMVLLQGLATAWAGERIGRRALRRTEPRAVGTGILGAVGVLGYLWLGTALAEVV